MAKGRASWRACWGAGWRVNHAPRQQPALQAAPVPTQINLRQLTNRGHEAQQRGRHAQRQRQAAHVAPGAQAVQQDRAVGGAADHEVKLGAAWRGRRDEED